MKKIKVTWMETVTQEVTAIMEVDDDFIVGETELLNMDINPENYYIDEDIYEKIEFADYGDILYSETLEFHADSVKIMEVKE